MTIEMTIDRRHSRMSSPVGPLLLLGNGRVLSGVYMDGPTVGRAETALGPRDDAAFSPARAQLEAYFSGALKTFDLAFSGSGTPFQQRVWRALCEIPYGEHISYGELARRIGQPTASRAVGLANGRNPISIIVPCHRVIGASGALTGYSGGIEHKRWLLAHEASARTHS